MRDSYTQEQIEAWNAALEKAARDLDEDRESEVWIDPVDPSRVLDRSARRIRGMKLKARTTATSG